MSSSFMQKYSLHSVIVALGSNKTGPWGDPMATLQQVLEKLSDFPLKVIKSSSFYETKPIGATQQEFYINSAAILKTSLAPDALLHKFKQIERDAGRKARGRPWGARSLDIDLIGYKACLQNWDLQKKQPKQMVIGGLIIPHAHAHLRPFVLEPLAEIAPDWRHPVLGQSVLEMLSKVRQSTRLDGMIFRKIENIHANSAI